MVRNAGPGKKPTSAYGFFVKMCYEEHKKKYPNENVQVTEISKKCSEKWKTMTDVEKRRFYELAQKDTERYHAELASMGEYPKRKRQKKDPNAPKRALSAFFSFSQERRAAIQQGHPDWRVGQVAQELGRMWKEMSTEEKQRYEEMASRDRGRYELEMKDFKAGRPVASRQAAVAAGGAASGPSHSGAQQQQAMPQHFGAGVGMPLPTQPHPPYQQQMQQQPQHMMQTPQMQQMLMTMHPGMGAMGYSGGTMMPAPGVPPAAHQSQPSMGVPSHLQVPGTSAAAMQMHHGAGVGMVPKNGGAGMDHHDGDDTFGDDDDDDDDEGDLGSDDGEDEGE